jgi:hypothetical protein
MGDLRQGRSALVRSYEVAVMLFGFGRLRFFRSPVKVTRVETTALGVAGRIICLNRAGFQPAIGASDSDRSST